MQKFSLPSAQLFAHFRERQTALEHNVRRSQRAIDRFGWGIYTEGGRIRDIGGYSDGCSLALCIHHTGEDPAKSLRVDPDLPPISRRIPVEDIRALTHAQASDDIIEETRSTTDIDRLPGDDGGR